MGDRLSALTPDETDPQAVANEITRIVSLPAGQHPERTVVDFIGDGATEMIELAEKMRIDFAHRLGFGDLLQPSVSV